MKKKQLSKLLGMKYTISDETLYLLCGTEVDLSDADARFLLGADADEGQELKSYEENYKGDYCLYGARIYQRPPRNVYMTIPAHIPKLLRPWFRHEMFS